jgi:hypothetical protein
LARQIPKVGDVFTVPLDDGSHTLGQVVETDPILMNSITCVFYDARSFDVQIDILEALGEVNPIACQFVTRDQFNKGKWRRIGRVTPTFSQKQYPYRETRKNGWIGAKVIGSGIINDFLSAFYGLRDWEEMKDPKYYSTLMLPGVSRSV